MTDALGWRRKFGVIAPSTNTIVEPDFSRMTVPGVTAHFSRIHIRDQNMDGDSGMERLLEQTHSLIGQQLEQGAFRRPIEAEHLARVGVLLLNRSPLLGSQQRPLFRIGQPLPQASRVLVGLRSSHEPQSRGFFAGLLAVFHDG